MPVPAPPANPVFPAGYDPLTADMNSLVQVPFQFLTGRIVFRGHQQSSQSVTSSGGYQVITLDHVTEDPYGGWVSGSNWWLAPYDGWYEATGYVSVATTTASVQGGFSLTGLTTAGSEVPTSSAFLGGVIAYAVVPMVQGQDYLALTAAASATFPTDTSATGRYPSLEIRYLGRGNSISYA
jgi:hypothetical protein